MVFSGSLSSKYSVQGHRTAKCGTLKIRKPRVIFSASAACISPLLPPRVPVLPIQSPIVWRGGEGIENRKTGAIMRSPSGKAQCHETSEPSGCYLFCKPVEALLSSQGQLVCIRIHAFSFCCLLYAKFSDMVTLLSILQSIKYVFLHIYFLAVFCTEFLLTPLATVQEIVLMCFVLLVDLHQFL